MALDGMTPGERETVSLVDALSSTGNLHPLIARLREDGVGPERARDALRTLAELDLDLLVQITLDTLIDAYVTDPGVAHQTRRAIRGGMGYDAPR